MGKRVRAITRSIFAKERSMEDKCIRAVNNQRVKSVMFSMFTSSNIVGSMGVLYPNM